MYYGGFTSNKNQWNDGNWGNGTWYDGTQITFICEWDEVSANSGATVDEEAMARAAAMLLDDECWMKTGGEDVLATHYHVMDMNQGSGS